jgi:hypothetical protein
MARQGAVPPPWHTTPRPARSCGVQRRSGYLTSLAVSPDGRSLFVAGSVTGTSSEDHLTVAYNAATGAQRWVSRYNAPPACRTEPPGWR